MRNKIDPSQHGFWERFFINIPFVIIVALTVAFFGCGALLMFYSFVSVAAFKSAMIFLIVFGGSIFATGAGLVLIYAFRKFHVYYEKKMDIFQATELKTTSETKKSFAEYLTLSNISYTFMIIGCVLCLISALLGCTNRDKWLEATSSYIDENGYYADVKTFEIEYYVYDVTTFDFEVKNINIDFSDKKAVIIYTYDDDKQGRICVSTYVHYPNQVSASLSSDHKTFSITDNPAPEISNTVLNKLLFFVFDDNYFENQVKIYVPADFRNEVLINDLNADNPHITAQD